MFSDSLVEAASTLLEQCKSRGLKITTAESCTGGLLSALITEIAGSSAVFERGFITYSNEAKTELLGVDSELISEDGAVNEMVAVAMACGARQNAKADIAVSITGIAGPGGGSKKKPIGTVCIAVASMRDTKARTFYFSGNRQDIRLQSVQAAISLIDDMLSNGSSYVA